MKYVVEVAGRRWQVVVEGERVWVDGVEHRAELRSVEGSPRKVLVLDGVSIPLVAESPGRGSWMVYAEGERWEVEVVDERTERARRTAGRAVAHPTPPALKAPMPGLVARVLVEVGHPVEEGTSLVVLEAMKMETSSRLPDPAWSSGLRFGRVRP